MQVKELPQLQRRVRAADFIFPVDRPLEGSESDLSLNVKVTITCSEFGWQERYWLLSQTSFLVSANRRIDVSNPRQDAPTEILRLREAHSRQEFHRLRAPHTGTAVDDDRVSSIQLVHSSR